MDIKEKITSQAREAKSAARILRTLSTEVKNEALENIAKALKERSGEILETNKKDIEALGNKEVSAAFMSRLTLNEEKIDGIIGGIKETIKLPDPVGEVVETINRPNGLRIEKIRIPIGVLCSIYESRQCNG